MWSYQLYFRILSLRHEQYLAKDSVCWELATVCAGSYVFQVSKTQSVMEFVYDSRRQKFASGLELSKGNLKGKGWRRPLTFAILSKPSEIICSSKLLIYLQLAVKNLTKLQAKMSEKSFIRKLYKQQIILNQKFANRNFSV